MRAISQLVKVRNTSALYGGDAGSLKFGIRAKPLAPASWGENVAAAVNTEKQVVPVNRYSFIHHSVDKDYL
ncbi:hypothetical protein SKAU_G00065840 [Synaphobranchus kaupii]|uniref:Uncharacterized protein n=1 Tax=Synaphobranchus kaupii TaxID=118154 RepID=A0A9Q1J919_SYNKA|nr:hypothetical protein SKAU_G00065840 [Synaphobranchus kaupii]